MAVTSMRPMWIWISSARRSAVTGLRVARASLASVEGQQSGLRQDSVVNCINIATLHESKILRILGALPSAFMTQINACLKVALEIP